MKQRVARLEKLQASEDYVKKPPFTGKPFRFRFPPAPRLSDEVAMVEGVTHGYEGNPLFAGADMVIEKGNRVALLGPNGSGKSTMLRLVVGKEVPKDGDAKVRAARSDSRDIDVHSQHFRTKRCCCQQFPAVSNASFTRRSSWA